MRSTEGQFPYWLGVDDRLIADEFFRGSYTSGVWLKGEFHTKVKYQAMFANNLSTLGVSAAQLDNKFDTQSYVGDVAADDRRVRPVEHVRRLRRSPEGRDPASACTTPHSLEEKQSQPGTEGIENSQIRLTDGSVIFTPDLFGPGITVNEVDYRMSSVDAGVKYKGLSLEGEYYWRWLSNYTGVNTGGIPDINDHGYQLQASGMAVPKVLQLYFGASQIFGQLRRPVGSARRRELVRDEGARHSRQRRVDVREPLAGGIHGLSLPGRRQGHRCSTSTSR